ncbi:MAG TPA: TetR family transcriptional regulator [Pseudonocardiaceae bacterium]|jgi:AcrR family transcriptional regulator|nr:TetR family transcriptional regulator [Pseudonocardiaceae bacterium]
MDFLNGTTQRERNKVATRDELAKAAFQLAVERGLDNVRVGDIAAAAGVSPRTFNNYFDSKEAAVVARAAWRMERTADSLEVRPLGEPLKVSLVEAVVDRYASPSQRFQRGSDWQAGFRLMVTEPALRGEFLKGIAEMERSLAEAISARIYVPMGELYARVLAAAVVGAERAAIGHWIAGGQSEPLVEVVRQAVSFAVAGVSEEPGTGEQR